MKCRKKIIPIVLIFALVIFSVIFSACSQEVITVSFYVDGELYEVCRADSNGSLLDYPDVPVKEGYKGKWSINNFDELTESIEVNAIYEKDIYTVSFYADGVLVKSISEKKGKTISQIPDVPYKEGYKGKWNVNIFSGISNDTSVYAVYEKLPVYITFYKKDIVYQPVVVTAGEKVKSNNYYERTASGYVLTEDATFKLEKTYYNAKREVYTRVLVTNGRPEFIPELPKSDNLSVKWMKFEQTENGEVYSTPNFNEIKENTDIVAYEYVTATLIDNFGNEVLQNEAKFEIKETADFIESPISERVNYDFYGWYYDQDLLNKVVFPYTFTENITLYAKWMSKKATVGLSFKTGKVVSYNGTEEDVFIPYKHKDEDGKEYIITKIADNAFANNTLITKVNIPGTVTELGDNAFSGCTYLTKVVFSDGTYIENIGEGAFEGCTSLIEFLVSPKTKTIGERAFYGCTNLLNVLDVDLSSIIVISDFAFCGCEKLKAISLPKTVTTIGKSAFENNYCLNIDFIDEGNLSTIGEKAFYGCELFTGISSINIKAVGKKAFANCRSLTDVTFPAGMKAYQLFAEREELASENDFYFVTTEGKEYAIPKFLYSVKITEGDKELLSGTFADIYSVKEITLCDGITTIQTNAFIMNMYEISDGVLNITLPETLAIIQTEAFASRTDIKSIALPASLKEIGAKAFYGLINLSSVTIPSKNSLVDIGQNVFGGTEWYNDYDGMIILGKIVVGISEVWCRNRGYERILASDMGSCEKIAPYAFYGNSIITEVNLGERIGTVGEFAFANCNGLTKFVFNSNQGSVTQRTIEGNILSNVELIDLTLYEDVAVSNLFESMPNSLEVLRLEFAGKNSTIEAGNYDTFATMKELYIGNGFEVISNNAFSSCCALEKVKVAKDIRIIGDKAFYGLALLTTLDLSDNEKLDAVGKEAFMQTSLNGVKLPNTVRIIEDRAFKGACLSTIELSPITEKVGVEAFNGNTDLKIATLNEGLKEIGDYAFRDCKIELLTLPSSIVEGKLGKGIIADNSNFKTLIVSAGLSVPSLFTVTIEENDIIDIPINFTTIIINSGEIIDNQCLNIPTLQTVTIEKGVTEIGKSAFEGCSGIKNISVPGTVTEIRDRAFANCTAMISCRIDSVSSKLKSIGKELFIGDTKIEYAMFPITIERGDWTGMFDGCASLLVTNLPESITTVGEYAYRDCISLTTVGMHNKVYEIQKSAFEGCCEIDFDDVSFDSLRVIGERAFAGCDKMHGIKANYAEEIGENAYAESGEIREITILGQSISYYTDTPSQINTVNVVGIPANNAFNGCNNLETIIFISGTAQNVIDSLESVDMTKTTVFVKNDIYEQVSAVKEVHINPTSIDYFTFSYFEDTLTSTIKGLNKEKIIDTVVYLPSEIEKDGKVYKITKIGASAFDSANIVSVTIPSGITEIGTKAFKNSSISKLRFESGSKLEIIRSASFESCTSLTHISFPSSLMIIESNAFQNCTGLINVSFYANSKLESIGSYAFSGVSNLKTISLTGPINSIGNASFYGCVSMESFDFGEKCKIIQINNSLFDTCSSLNQIVLPETVKIIGNNAFKKCSELSSIDLPERVSSIGDNAFSCSGIVSIKLNDNLISIGNSSFESCEKLEKVIIPNKVKTVGERAFYGCYALSEVTVGEEVSEIGNSAFEWTRMLQKLNFNAKEMIDSVEDNRIFRYAGQNTDLSVVFGKTAQRVPAYMFYADGTSDGAPRITAVKFTQTSSVKEIGSNAFAQLNSLYEITIPVSVLLVGSKAFYGSSALNVTLEASRAPAGYANDWNDGIGLSITFGKDNLVDGEYKYVVHENSAYLTDYLGDSTEIIVPSRVGGYNVADVGASFESNTQLESIIIPEGIKGIGSYYGCNNLKEIELSEGIINIPDRAFYDCQRLNAIVIPSSVRTVGKDAFTGCIGLLSVYTNSTFVAGVLNNDNLSGSLIKNSISVYVKNTISGTVIEEDTYRLLPEEKNEYFVYTKLFFEIGKEDDDDVYAYLLGKDKEDSTYGLTIDGNGSMRDFIALALVPWNKYSDSITEIIIKEEVAELGMNAFAGLSALQSVYYNARNANQNENKNFFTESGTAGFELFVGESAKMLPAYMFYRSSTLKKITYSNNTVLETIGVYAFSQCNALAEINIPNSVTTIKANAFESCVNVISITIGKGVKDIGERAFFGLNKLAEIEFNAVQMNDGVGNKYTFDNTVNTAENGEGFMVNIGANSTRIPAYLFYGCKNLLGVNFYTKGSLSVIGREAFYQCEWLTSITLPASLVSIGERAFAECKKLSSVNIGTGTACLREIGKEVFINTRYYTNDDNWLVNEEGSGALYLLNTYLIKAKSGLSGEYTVLGSAKIVANGAFDGCNGLEFIRIPASMEYIGESAFNGCNRLKTVYISSKAIAEGFTEMESEGGVVANALHVYIAKTLIDDRNIKVGRFITTNYTAIEGEVAFTVGSYYAFTKTAWDTSYDDNQKIKAYLINDEKNAGFYSLIIKGEGKMANYSLENLMPWKDYLSLISKVYFENGITNVGSFSMYGCTELREVSMSASVEEIGENAFKDCQGITSLEIPEKVTKISNNAFKGCVNVKTIRYLAKNVTDFVADNGVFADVGINSESGIDVKIDKNVIYIPAYLFNPFISGENMPAVKTIEFLSVNNVNGVETIGPYAFANLALLQTIRFAKGSTLKTIGDCAFKGCTAITSLEITMGINNLGKSAFADCIGITQIVFRAEEFYESPKDNNVFENVGKNNNYTLTITNKAKGIPSYLFESSAYLVSLLFEDDGICESIGNYAFEDCIKLKEVVIPSTEEFNSVGEGAFSGCSSLTRYVAPFIGGKSEEVEASQITLFGYVFGKEPKEKTTETIQSYGGGVVTYYIPDSLIYVEATIYTNVYCGMFENCNNIRTVVLNTDSIVDTLIKTGINEETGLEEIKTQLANGSLIQANAFHGCSSLTTVTLTNQISIIGDNAFSECRMLNSILIGANVKEIGESAFHNCSALTQINYNAKSVGDLCTTGGQIRSLNVFAGAGIDKSGINVIIGKEVERIPSFMFATTNKTSPKLASIEFEDNSKCKYIGQNAFYNAGADTLMSISLPTTLLSVGECAFEGTAFYLDNSKWQGDVLYIDGVLIKTKLTNVSGVVEYTVLSGTYLIADKAFYGCRYLAKINISSTVRYIGKYVFAECIGLKELHSEVLSLLETIGDYAFSNCSLLGTALNDNREEIGFYVRNKVKTIGNYAFSGCVKISKIYIDSPSVAGGITTNDYITFGGILMNSTDVYISGEVQGISSYIINNYETTGAVVYGYKKFTKK